MRVAFARASVTSSDCLMSAACGISTISSAEISTLRMTASARLQWGDDRRSQLELDSDAALAACAPA
jgi:hypothetical protein